MKTLAAIIIFSMCIIVSVFAEQPGYYATETEAAVRFAPLHVYIDSGSHSLGAFQFELRTTRGNIKIVGVEGGEHKAYRQPPTTIRRRLRTIESKSRRLIHPVNYHRAKAASLLCT